MSRPDFFSRLESPSRLSHRKILIYGPSRSGKTSFIGSAAFDTRTSPMLLLDFEGGSTSLVGVDDRQLQIYRIRTWQDYNEAYEFLLNDNVNDDGEPIFKSIGIDSITETHYFSIFSVVERDLEINENRRKRGGNEYTVEEADYGKSLNQMRRFLREFRDIPNVHCFFTALAKTTVEPREGSVRKPSMLGQLAEEVVGMFDVSAYLTVSREENDSVVRTLVLQNYPGIRSGIRLGFDESIPDEITIENPTAGVSLLFDLLNIPFPS